MTEQSEQDQLILTYIKEEVFKPLEGNFPPFYIEIKEFGTDVRQDIGSPGIIEGIQKKLNSISPNLTITEEIFKMPPVGHGYYGLVPTSYILSIIIPISSDSAQTVVPLAKDWLQKSKYRSVKLKKKTGDIIEIERENFAIEEVRCLMGPAYWLIPIKAIDVQTTDEIIGSLVGKEGIYAFDR